MNNKDKQLSKILSWLLRHGALKEKLKISLEGYISVQDILEHKSLRGKYNISDIKRIVNTNDKQRFKLRNNPISNALEIKANQGHTIKEIDNSELIPIVEPKYKTVVHGTYYKHWQQIKIHGLSRIQRNHIHFAKGTLSDPTVVSGLRRNIEIYIFIDLKKAQEEGLNFYESENGVILTEGNDKGFLEPKYFLAAIEVGTGFPTYTQPQDLTRVFTNYGTVNVEKINNRYAILAFSNDDEAKEAIDDSDKVNIYGEFLTVKPFTGRAEQSDTPKFEFYRTKQKDVIIDPQLIDLSGDFHQQLDRVLNAVRLNQEEVTNLSTLYSDLEFVLQQQWPGCVAMPFGSITTGLGIKTSDADCFINVPSVHRHPHANFVNKTKKLLQQYPRIFAEILAIPRANTPIVKFFHVPTETDCDVTFKTPLGAQNSKLIAFLLHADPRLLPVAVVIKYWAKVHGFSGTGKLTNYALTVLVVFYLQQPPVSLLPSVEWLQRDPSAALDVDFWNAGFASERALLPESTNTSSISELLGGFFQYYSTFDFNQTVVSPFLGRPVKKQAFRDPSQLPAAFERYRRNVADGAASPLRVTTSICVQDPFELCHNVASSVTNRLASSIKEFFAFAATAYDQEKLGGCEGFLRTILLQEPKLPRGNNNPAFRVSLFPHVLDSIVCSDWSSVVRETIRCLFEQICKIELNEVDEQANPGAKRRKERFSGTITRAIWKRKQFSRLYGVMNLDFLQRQTRITEEILKADKQTYNVQFNLTLSFTVQTRNATVTINMAEGDAAPFKEFGKFFLSVMHGWTTNLLKPHLLPGETTKPNESAENNQNNADKTNDNGEIRGISASNDDGALDTTHDSSA